MSVQMSVELRNARLDAFETIIGTGARLKIFTGTKPANVAAADSGTLLADVTCPSDWLGAAANGVKSLAGVWEDLSANGAGDAGHFRLYQSNGTTCHFQGTVTATGGGGDMTVNNITFASGQKFSITTFTLNEPGA